MKRYLNLANILSASRILFASLILFTPAFSALFFVFYLLGAATDMIDGTVARLLHQESDFGAKLDTAADFSFVAAVSIKIVPRIHIPVWLWLWIAFIFLLKIIALISVYVLHHRLLSEHTIMNKVTGALLFLLPIMMGLKLFPRQALAVACILTCSVATFAAIQEGYYVIIGKEV